MTRKLGSFSPDISDVSTAVPEVVYSPMVLLQAFATNKLVPDIATPVRKVGPMVGIIERYTVAPEGVNLPIPPVPPVTVTIRFPLPSTAKPQGEAGS